MAAEKICTVSEFAADYRINIAELEGTNEFNHMDLKYLPAPCLKLMKILEK